MFPKFGSHNHKYISQPSTNAIQPPRELDKRLQVDWARDAREGPRILMSLRVDFGPMDYV